MSRSRNSPILNAPQYVPERDGALLNYLQTCADERRFGLFLGPEHFRDLWDANLLEPGATSIRIMYNQGSDEHYLVVDRNSVEGIEGEKHSGRPGVHPIDDVIPKERVMFEVYLFKRPTLSSPQLG